MRAPAARTVKTSGTLEVYGGRLSPQIGAAANGADQAAELLAASAVRSAVTRIGR